MFDEPIVLLVDVLVNRILSYAYEESEVVPMNESYLSDNYPDYDDLCAVESSDRRFYMAVAGTVLSFISLFCNLLIAKVLYSSKHAHFFFLALLAVSDCFLSMMYGPVIAMDIIKDKVQILWLTRLYWWYVGPLLALCQVSMTFSCYLIILATIERYLITQRSDCLKRFRRSRGLMALFMFLLSLLLRGTLVFEIQLDKNGDCTGIAEYIPGLTDIVHTVWYGTVFRFYIRNIMTVFLPFFLLAYLNYRIVRTLRNQQRSAQMFRLSSDHKLSNFFVGYGSQLAMLERIRETSKIRSATRLLVLIVCSYLLANVLNVLITLWEYVAFQSTQTQEAYVIYEACTDVISVLYVLVCATRLFVYISCNKIFTPVPNVSRSFRSARSDYGRDGFLSTELNPTRTPMRLSGAQHSRQIGTDVDSIAIAIARRLIHNEETIDGVVEDAAQSSPLQSIVYANDHARNNEIL
ncbi:7 transmembrane receptor [Teladorsagia circumcincta]|uniref:7 transmembrane receptor n=1 Tax=Teladorsagia circumcincta TaxID=45464 RepID=A0A2G9UYK3_TELCI|nr:7 transmembrane receptor [Teladorsagia circumcincta]